LFQGRSQNGQNCVVALDNGAFPDTPRIRIGRISLFRLSGLTATVAILTVLAAISANGFSENGFRLGSQLAWRFTFFVFFAMLAAGPVCNLAPFGLCRCLGPQRRQLVWSFCAAFDVYLLSVFLPNLLLPSSLHQDGVSGGMALFVLFGGALAASMAYVTTQGAAALLGERAQRAILAVAASYFWLCYALAGLERISGPHRPDLFSNVSLSLMIVALLLRFADRFKMKWTGAD
jgi:hypothetical protein